MAFHSNTGEQKIRINLSKMAIETINYDMFVLKEERIGTFINYIFSTYYEFADASIGRALHEKKEEYLKILKLENDENNDYLTLLLENYKENLIQKKEAYEKGESITFRLNNKNFNYLTEGALCNEHLYYSSISEYVKSVIEEYTRLPYIKRELILFKDRFDTITEAIQKNHQLHITTQGQNCYLVYPYSIQSDPFKVSHYLVCYYIKSSQKFPCSFRIANIEQIASTRFSAKLTKDDKKELENLITTRGVQFIVSSEDMPIKVRLTKRGEQLYHSNLYLRPKYATKSSNGIYIFHCTQAQARYYFFKFGKEAEIIEPIELRQKFATNYAKAYKVYTNTSRKSTS